MAHFAEVIDEIVIRVVVVDNADITDSDGIERPVMAIDFLPLTDGQWIQTSYSGSFRSCFAGIGYTYDPIADVFAPPAPAESLTDDTTTV